MHVVEGLHMWMSIFVQNLSGLLLLNISVRVRSRVILLSLRLIVNFGV
jgi:hypothetical protein